MAAFQDDLDSVECELDAFTYSMTAKKRARLSTFIRRHGGRITPRQVVREGPYYRTAANARRALDDLVKLGIGRWIYSKPGPTGGRPQRVFVLTTKKWRIRTRPADQRAIDSAVCWGLISCGPGRALACDVADAIRCQMLDDPGLTAAEIDCVMSNFSRAMRTILPVGHRPDKTPSRRPWEEVLWG